MLTITTPLAYQVNQRGPQNAAYVTVSGFCPERADGVICQFVPVQGGTLLTQRVVPTSGSYSGSCLLKAGWYSLTVIAINGSAELERATVARVGVGEVFLIAGHSVAHGDGKYSLGGSTDERVVCVPFDAKTRNAAYLSSGSAADLPMAFGSYADNTAAAPFGTYREEAPYPGVPHFWAKFGEQVASRLNVPVFIMNAAFGGTTLEHWARSSQGQPFEHSFVRSGIGMPYVNVKNALSRYVSLTGLRAVLCDHGQNDWPETDENKVVLNYRTWVQQARTDLGYESLPFVINRQTPFLNTPLIRRAQERTILETTGAVAGPDYDADLIDSVDRYDGIHLNLSGQAKAAKLWADVVTRAEFLNNTRPYQPRPVTDEPVAAVVSGDELRIAVADAPPRERVELNLSFLAGMGLMASLGLLLFVAVRLVNRIKNRQTIQPA